MNRFTKQHLGELVDILSGFAFDSKKFGDSGELPIVRIRDVIPGSSSTFYSGEYDPKFVIRDGDLLIGMDGEFNRARWQGGNALLNQRVCRIVASSRDLDDAYLFHFLPKALKAIEDVTPYVTVKHLSVKTIRDIEISLPPLEEQRRIAEVLDHAEELRSKRREAIAQLDTLTQAIFIEMFGAPVVNPKGWEVRNMNECAERIQIGPFGTQLHEEDYIDNGIPLINPTHIQDGKIFSNPSFSISSGKHQQLSQYHLEVDDVILGRRGEMGRCAINCVQK